MTSVRPRAGRSQKTLRVLAAGMLLTVLGPPLALAADSVAFTLSDDRITESSGLATDPDNDRYWTVNDSGDSGVAYALAADGDVEGTLSYRAEPTDVEAVAMDGDRLYVADIGDNRAERGFVTVYFFADARPAEQPRTYQAYDFAFPGGPRDAETLLVDENGRLYIVSKQGKGGIYRAPLLPSRTGINELERVGDAPAYVTDGTFLPNGQIALRTYVSVVVLDPDSYETVATAPIPTQPQGESITVSLDGDHLLLGSEGRNSKVYEMDVPTAVGPVPSAKASPPKSSPRATASADQHAASDDTEAEEEPAPAARSSGTRMAIGMAAALAVVAGLVVALLRRP